MNWYKAASVFKYGPPFVDDTSELEKIIESDAKFKRDIDFDIMLQQTFAHQLMVSITFVLLNITLLVSRPWCRFEKGLTSMLDFPESRTE